MSDAPRNPAPPARPAVAGPDVRGSRPRRRGLVAAALVALAVLPYANALDAGFVYDDDGLVRKHSAVQAEFDPVRAVITPYWDARDDTRLWRPFVTLSFAIDDALADDSARLMHAVNVAVHALVTLLAWTFLRRFGASAAAAFGAAALFAVHPLHTEAVTWVSGRAELFAALGVFAALLAALHAGRAALAACAIATFFAVASKESAAVLPVYVAALAWIARRPRRPAWGAVAASGAGLALYLALRFGVLDTLAGPLVGANENAMVGTGVIERLPTVLDAAGRYVALLVWPRTLAIDYGPPVLGLLDDVSGFAVLGSGVAFGLVAATLLRRHERFAAASAFTLLFYAVASNLVVVIGTNFAERLFYLPSFGLLWIVAESGARIARRSRSARFAASALLVAALCAGSARTFVRNFDYRDDLTLSEAALAVHPNSPKMLYNRARELGRRGRHEEAVEAAREALALGGNAAWGPVVLANSLVALGREAEAEQALRDAVATRPRDLPARHRWIQLLEQRGDRAAANRLAESAIEAGWIPADPAVATEFWARAAEAAQARGALEVAAVRWARVVETEPRGAIAWTQLGLSLFGLERAAEARAAFERALAVDPDAASAANALAWLLLDAGETDRALDLARNAVERAGTPEHRDTYARALEAVGDCTAALEQARLAASSGGSEFEARRDELAARCGVARTPQ